MLPLRLLLASLSLSLAAAAQSGIVGSVHDFSAASFNVSKAGEICGVCHIPHEKGRPQTQLNNPLLWGRSMSQQTFTVYASPTLNGTISSPDGSAKLCLSCHDGTVALEHFNGQTSGGATFISQVRASAVVPGLPNGNMANTHPVSITYDNIADRGLHNPATRQFGTVPGRVINDVLEGGKVQCRTCHDVHNKDVQTPDSGPTYLLRVAIRKASAPSGLCLTCHDK
jgi:hypothetical protein